jgi:hypothetical protein
VRHRYQKLAQVTRWDKLQELFEFCPSKSRPFYITHRSSVVQARALRSSIVLTSSAEPPVMNYTSARMVLRKLRRDIPIGIVAKLLPSATAISDRTTEVACGASIFVYWIVTSRPGMKTAAPSLIRSLILVLSSTFSSNRSRRFSQRWRSNLPRNIQHATIPQTRVQPKPAHVARRMYDA